MLQLILRERIYIKLFLYLRLMFFFSSKLTSQLGYLNFVFTVRDYNKINRFNFSVSTLIHQTNHTLSGVHLDS